MAGSRTPGRRRSGMRPKRRFDRIDFVDIDGELVLYDEEDDSIHHLNSTAGIVWRICDGTATMPEIAAEIADAFGQPAARVERDVRAAVRSLGDAGLMEVPRPRKQLVRAENGRAAGTAATTARG